MKIFKKILLILSVFLHGHLAYSQNQTLLFVEDFEDASSLLLNFPLSGQPNNGNNQWIRNNIYDGLGFYPNTPPQDSTFGNIGQIGTPNGYYIHIKNTSVPVFNANYDPLNISNRAAVLNNGICTYGFNKVTLVFWWLAKGSPADYGEVYYSIDGGGTWNLTTNIEGYSKYYNMDKWKFAEIELAVFLNQNDLRFAFKWTNDGINTNDVLPFSIDDILIVGEFDPALPAANIDAIFFSDTTICHEDLSTLTFQFFIDDTLCPGTYEIEFSDENGDFNNSYTLCCMTPGGTFNYGLSWYSLPPFPPTSLPFGTCYKFRVNRITPPYITGIAYSGCIEIIDCSEYIEVLDPPPAVLQDPYYNPSNPANPPGLPAGQQPICLNSVIDVKFFTYGAYNPGNNYILELSDSSGSFDDPTTIGGPMPSTQTHDPAIYPMQSPGSISGTIPDSVNGERLPEGCNYYIRVVSTDPVVDSLSTPWGPFCIMECDILTNNGEDISVCITDGCNATISKTITVGTTDQVDFSYTVTTNALIDTIIVINTSIFNDQLCAYIDTTIIDTVFDNSYIIDITGSGPWGSGWSWYVNGDLQSPGDSMNPSFIYTCPGTYTVSLVASDSCVNPVVKDVQIGFLSAGFSYQADSTTVSFTNNSIYLPEDSISWEWDFGNGWMSDEQNPVHEYNSCYGSYTVTLTITTRNCCSTSYTEDVLAGDLVADFGYSVSGNTVTFSDSSIGDIATWIWDYGDGNTDIFGTIQDTNIIPNQCGVIRLTLNL